MDASSLHYFTLPLLHQNALHRFRLPVKLVYPLESIALPSHTPYIEFIGRPRVVPCPADQASVSLSSGAGFLILEIIASGAPEKRFMALCVNLG